MKKRVLSGMRPTGRLHLGNYLGGVKGMLKLQEDPEYETLYFIVDLHAMTTPYKKEELSTAVRELALDYLAAGLDPEKSTIFVQSHVPQHMELFYYFSTVVSVARMRHLPTFKDKVKQHPENVTMALLNYPILMAADILAYEASAVPVGIDQEPHLEVAREIARKMNDRYGTDFPEPKRFASKGEYVPSLLGEGKMSKSVEGSFVNLTDSYEVIKKKIRSVPTETVASGKKIEKGTGINTLFELMRLFSQPMGSEKFKEYIKMRNQYMKDSTFRFVELKDELARLIYKELEPIQKKRRELEKNPKYVDRVIKEGAEKAGKIARNTVAEVKEKMGLT